jgi:hypothetical protein
LREGEVDVLSTVTTRHLLLGLLAERDDTVVLADTLTLSHVLPRELGDGGVDTTAETTVGGSDDVEDLLDLRLRLGSLGLVEDGLVGGTVDLGVTHGSLSATKTGSGNHLLSAMGWKEGGRTNEAISSAASLVRSWEGLRAYLHRLGDLTCSFQRIVKEKQHQRLRPNNGGAVLVSIAR